MSLLPKSKEEFSQKEYWDAFFKKRGSKAFEWYGEYPELATHLHKYIKKQDSVLIVGCGNSSLGRDLYDIGYSNITNVDISPVVIKQMLQNKRDRPDLKFIQMDALNMTFDNEIFSVILDKGTLDALMPNDNEETLSNINKYFCEIQRVLKIGGRYICISLLQEHILKMVLNYFPKNNWMFRVVRCFEAENKAIENGDSSMPVFFIICTKFKQLPSMVLEVNLNNLDKMQKVESPEEIISSVSNIQQAAFICAGIRNTNLSEKLDTTFELYRPGDRTPRYTIFIVDVEAQQKNLAYAAFIVPQGREAEWMFSTMDGRNHLVKMTKHNRLTIITLHRNQKYGTIDDVKNELTDTVCSLAPSKLKDKKIAFLSLGSDVGSRTIRCQGTSNYSGDYVVEDVETENGNKLRRLFYLSSQLVIQSDAKLKTIKTRKGIQKEIIDLNFLTCKHHVYMSLATSLLCQNKNNPSIYVIGLGGGGLCSFLHKFLPNASIIGIDIDDEMQKIALNWFGLQLDSKLKVHIQDGVEFLKDAVLKGEIVDGILFDVDSKDSSMGMSCPPKEFLDNDILENIKNLIGEKGLFILNLVLRDLSLRPPIIDSLKKKFKLLISYKLDEDLNEVIICTNLKSNVNHIQTSLKNCCLEINKYFKKHNADDNEVDVDAYMKALVINR